MNENERKKTTRKSIPWNAIRFSYVTRGEMPSYRRLGREFGVAGSTIMSRAAKENWSAEREKHRNNVQTEAMKTVGKAQAINLASSIRFLEGMIYDLMSKTQTVKPSSYEGLVRELRQTIKMRITLLDRPPERTAQDEENDKRLSKIFLMIKEKAPEEYEEIKKILELGDDEVGG